MKKVILIMTMFSLFPRLLAAQQLDVSALVGEDWYGVYMNGQKAGYSQNSVAVESNGSIVVTENAQFRVKMMDIAQEMQILLKRTYSKDGHLLRIEQQVKDVQGPKRFVATVEGDSMKLESTIAGVTQVETLPKPKESLVDAIKQMELVRKDAAVGDELTYTLFEPMYKRELEGVSRIQGIEERNFEGAKTKVFRIETTVQNMGIKSISYVTEKGKTLEDSIAGMLRMRLEPKEIAVDVNYNNDVIVSNAAMIDKPIPDPRTRKTIHLHVEGPMTADHLFSEERQTFTPAGTMFDFIGRKISLEGFTTAKLPIADESAKQWLKPSVFVQSEDPRLIKKAKDIAGQANDSFVVSSALCHWVYRNVKTTYSAQLSNALEVLDKPEGDCTEHSILFVGLARAIGLPAREVAGLIYVNNGQPAFYFHQWAKVWVGKWVDVDPTFDQPVADATHIKLAEGDLFEQAKLIPVIGKLKVTVLEDVKP